MFIELADVLRCPQDHPEAYCVLTPETMLERNVVTGTVGCPICRREYQIADGIVAFGDAPHSDPTDVVPEPAAVHALLGLSTPGGYAMLVGSATRLADALVDGIGGVHFVAVNPPPGVHPAPQLSVLRSPVRIPLRAAAVRGAVLGGEFVEDKWLRECVRVLIPGARLVVAQEVNDIPGVRKLAVGCGLYVGEKEREY